MPELLIQLAGPALLTPELRAWISHRVGSGRGALTRTRLDGSNRSAMLLRVEVQGDSDASTQEEVQDLLTDLRLLGLRPSVVSEQVI